MSGDHPEWWLAGDPDPRLEGTHPMTQPYELKPCPFCGGSADVYEHTGRIMSGHYTAQAECDSCEEVKGALGYGRTKDEAYTEAIKRWNTRTPDLSRILKLAALWVAYYTKDFPRAVSDILQDAREATEALTPEDHQLLEAVLKE